MSARPTLGRIGSVRSLRFLAWILLALAALAVGASFHPMVRNVARAIRPSEAVDAIPPVVPEFASPAVVVFTKTNGFRHEEAISEGVPALEGIAARRGWPFYHTENGAVFDVLPFDRVAALVWLCTSGAPLSESQRSAVQGWVESGGGFVGIHAALDGSHASWDWYHRSIIGADFIGHPIPHYRAAIQVERPEHIAMRGLPALWNRKDEWYSWASSVRGDAGVEVLASLDETTYDPRMKMLWIDQDLTMGDHPIIWTRKVGQGRAFLSAPGHTGESYREPEYLSILERGIAWAGRLGTVETAKPLSAGQR